MPEPLTGIEKYFSIPLPNYPPLMELQDYLKRQLPSGTTFNDPATFHITLVFVEDDKGTDLTEVAVAENLPAFIVLGDYLRTFETPDGYAVVLEIGKSPQLIYLQAALFYELRKRGVDLSGLSWPGLWRAHVTLGYSPTDVDYYLSSPSLVFLPVEGYTLSAAGNSLLKAFPLEPQGFSGFKSLGDDGWVAFYSNIFPDRDIRPDAPHGERFPLPALKEYADWANSDPANLPELQFWHLPNMKMGQADEVAVIGPFIVAHGQWDETPTGQAAKAYFATSEADWRCSHGFKYRASDRVAGEYKRFRTHEVTVLPAEWAANPVTAFMEDKAMTWKAEAAQAIRNMLGISEDEAKQAVEQGIADEKARKDALTPGTQTGQKDGEAAPAAQGTPPATTPAAEPEVDPAVLAEVQQALADGTEAKQRVVALEKKFEEQTKAFQALTEAVQAQTKAIQESATSKQALLPRAVAAAMVQRASEKGVVVTDEEGQGNADQFQKSIGVEGESSNPLDWMAQQAGMLPEKK